jgi:hypothetical protein
MPPPKRGFFLRSSKATASAQFAGTVKQAAPDGVVLKAGRQLGAPVRLDRCRDRCCYVQPIDHEPLRHPRQTLSTRRASVRIQVHVDRLPDSGNDRMNALVFIALKRPYTFVVLAILILLFGAISVLQTATDIFPPIRIPVIAAVWTYNGLSPSDMSGRIIYYYERTLTTTVSGIEHIES